MGGSRSRAASIACSTRCRWKIGFDGRAGRRAGCEWAPPPVPVAGVDPDTRHDERPDRAPSRSSRASMLRRSRSVPEKELTASGELIVDPTRLVVNRLIRSPHSGGESNAAMDVPFGDAPRRPDGHLAGRGRPGADARGQRGSDADRHAARRSREVHRAGRIARSSSRRDLTALPAPSATPLAGDVSASLQGRRPGLSRTICRADGVSVSGKAGRAARPRRCLPSRRSPVRPRS